MSPSWKVTELDVEVYTVCPMKKAARLCPETTRREVGSVRKGEI